jgi:hypothetical protein
MEQIILVLDAFQLMHILFHFAFAEDHLGEIITSTCVFKLSTSSFRFLISQVKNAIQSLS